jgi:hypothetical protein
MGAFGFPRTKSVSSTGRTVVSAVFSTGATLFATTGAELLPLKNIAAAISPNPTTIAAGMAIDGFDEFGCIK